MSLSIDCYFNIPGSSSLENLSLQISSFLLCHLDLCNVFSIYQGLFQEFHEERLQPSL